MPYATTTDIEILRGAMTPNETAAAMFLIEEASAKLDVKVPSLVGRVADGSLNPVIPRGVVCRMVSDVLNNPTRFVSEHVEDAEFRFDPALVRQYMQPTDEEVADLSPAAGRRGVGRTIRVRCGW